MDKKIYLFAAVAVLLVGAGVYFSFSSPATTGAGKLETSHLNYDFGQLFMKNGKVSHEFLLRNAGSEAVTLGRISTSCMCTVAYIKADNKEIGPFGMTGMSGQGVRTIAGVTVNPGQEILLEVVFDPAAHGPSGAGYVERKIYADTDSSVQPQIVFGFSADVNL